LYMAAVAFTAYGVHWWALGMGRVFGSDPRPNALMAVPFVVLSVLGAGVFFGADDNPLGAVFVRLALVFILEFFASLGSPLWGAPARSRPSRPRAVADVSAGRRRAQHGARLQPPAVSTRPSRPS